MADPVVKKRRKPRKLTSSQLRVLGHLEQGRSYDFGVHGRAEYGGLACTMDSLCHRGLIGRNAGKWSLTDAGRAALAASRT